MQLQEKFNLYSQLVKAHQDKNGFIDYANCDSLLFSALLGCVPNTNVNINAALNPVTGMWHRRPLDYPECYDCKESKSTISRDQILGLAYFAYYNKRLDISEQLINYALTHWFNMGKGDKARTMLTPALLSTLAWISYRLGGPNRFWLRWIPMAETTLTEGYQAHLSVLHILLRNELTKKSKCINVLKHHANKEPMNPLFVYAVGDTETALNILSNESFWPTNRLPTSKGRKEAWLPQRNYGTDWKAAKGPEVTHSGADYLFMTWLITRA